MRAPLAALGIAAVLLASVGAAADEDRVAEAADGTPNCASRAEYDRLTVGMSTVSVRNLFDIPGIYDEAGPDTFARHYKTCWSDTRRIWVWYDQDAALSLRWDVRDA